MSELPKTYEPATVEPKWYAHWDEAGCFRADAHSPKPAFSIVIPPPNVTGILTLGHVLNNTIQDILARRARMQGFEVLWLPGTDHAGVGTQTAVEKHLRKTEKKTRHDLGREEFLRRVLDWQDKHGGIIIEQLKRLGCSCDWSRQRYTFDDDYVRAVEKVFVDLYGKGLIYRGRRMINWDPAAQTALSDEEVIAKPQKGSLYYVRYEIVEEPGRYLEVATTRPETIMADTAVAVHPNDKRYADLIGKHAWRPLAREKLPIIGDAVIDPEFGTGVLKVTPAHDKLDFEIGQRHKLPIIDVLHPDGKIDCPAVPELDGLDRFEARKKAAELLQEKGLLSKTEPHENNVGFSERSEVPIEPRLSEQWFLRYPKTKEALAVVRDHLIRFFPGHWEKVYGQWIENIQDWCISRQIWWGHRIPAWYSVARASSLRPNDREQNARATFRGFDEYSDVDVSRRNLPHWSQTGKTYFVTFRLADSLPAAKLAQLEEERSLWLAHHPLPWSDADKRQYYDRFSAKIDEWLDAGHGSCLLANEEVAKIVAAALQFFDGERYELGTWVVMPNHVHALVGPKEGHDLGAILHSWKSFTANQVNKQLGRSGPLWQHESYDHIVRNEAAFERIGEYISHNPERAGIRVTQASSLRAPEERKLEARATYVGLQPPPLDAENWTQDPDTLDTWFSAWLWAYETMDAETRRKFYPTSVLVTAPDIIFFWVARMIIAGLEFKPGKTAAIEDNIPFGGVYFTGLIRDKQGRKMSKSLGNSPNPLDLIDKYGADAIRIGVIGNTPMGEDVLFDEKNVELGRNFCTKLWNAVRFRQMHGNERERINPELLTSDDRSILYALDSAIKGISTSLDKYEFAGASIQLQGFLWGDFCDWYLEAAKAQLSDSDIDRKRNTLAVMDLIFDRTLRLLHPVAPFITEELWHELGFASDFPPESGGFTIMFAPWPESFTAEEIQRLGLTVEVAREVADRYGLVRRLRHIRTEHRIPSNKKVRVVYHHVDRGLSAGDWATLRQLAGIESVAFVAEYNPSKGEPVVYPPFGGKLFLPLEIDVAAERDRLDKEIAKLENELRIVETKLSNASFADKAPPAVVQEHRQRKVDFSEQLTQLRKARAAMD